MDYRNQTRIRGGYNGFAAGSVAPQQPQQMFPQAEIQQPASNYAPPAPPAATQPSTYAPHANNYSAPAPPPTPECPPEEGYYGEEMDQGPSYAGQICKIGGKNKFLSLHNELNLASRPGSHEDDYASLHGTGGKKHAVRSRIEARMCDYSGGTGEGKSVNVRYNLEPYYLLYLLEIVKAAMNGNLGQPQLMQKASICAQADGILCGWIKAQYQPSYNDLVGLHKMLAGNENAEAAVWSDFKEKNNPYPSACKYLDAGNGKKVEYTQVSTFQIQYNPTRNYQWTITISNFWAPISRQSKGTASHNSKAAIETKKVSIMATTEDMYLKLTQAEHFINQWERRAYPMLNAMCVKKEQEAEARRQQQNHR